MLTSPQLMLAQVWSPAAAARPGGVLGETYSLISCLTETSRMLVMHLLFQWSLAIFREGFCELCAKGTDSQRQNCLTVSWRGKILLLLLQGGIQTNVGWVGLNSAKGMIFRIATSVVMAEGQKIFC